MWVSKHDRRWGQHELPHISKALSLGWPTSLACFLRLLRLCFCIPLHDAHAEDDRMLYGQGRGRSRPLRVNNLKKRDTARSTPKSQTLSGMIDTHPTWLRRGFVAFQPVLRYPFFFSCSHATVRFFASPAPWTAVSAHRGSCSVCATCSV